jgi:hypothetical protein
VRALTVAFLAAALVAGCGSSSDRDHSAPTQAATTVAPTAGGGSKAPAKARLAPPCARRARGALARTVDVTAGSMEAHPYTAASSARACRLRTGAGGPTVIVMLDNAPQAYTRLEREVVEYGQNVLHSGRRVYPRTIKRLGLDADWFAAEDRLLTTDGVRLITVKLRWPSADPRRREALAIRLARVYLGPLHDPYG